MNPRLLVVPLLVALSACDDSPSRPHLPALALRAGEPGGVEVPALGLRIDLPAGSKVTPADADGYVTAGTKELSARLSRDKYGMTLRNALELPAMRGTTRTILEQVQGSDGWYLVTRSVMDVDPTPFYNATVLLRVADTQVGCSVGSRDRATVLAGLEFCRTMRPL